VEFRIDFQFRTILHQQAAKLFLSDIARVMVSSFNKRAETLYPPRSEKKPEGAPTTTQMLLDESTTIFQASSDRTLPASCGSATVVPPRRRSTKPKEYDAKETMAAASAGSRLGVSTGPRP